MQYTLLFLKIPGSKLVQKRCLEFPVFEQISLVFVEYHFHSQEISEGRDSAVGIAIRYGLDGPAIESRWERDFPHPTGPLLYNGYWVFPGRKAAGAWG